MKIITKWNELALYKIEKDYREKGVTDFNYLSLHDFCIKVCAIASKESKNNKYALTTNFDSLDETKDYLSKVGTTEKGVFHVNKELISNSKHWMKDQLGNLDWELTIGCYKSGRVETCKKNSKTISFDK